MVSNDGEAQLSFLLSGASDLLPSSYIKLRSYLNIHLSNIADQQNLNLPKSFRNRNNICLYCYSVWSSETTSFKLLPSKKSKLRLNEKEKEVKKDKIKESRNTLILRCKVCTRKSLFSLVKKKPVKVKEETVKSVKKKKKKKDKSCGLIVSLKKEENPVPEVSKKKKRSENTKQNKTSNFTSKHPQSNFSESAKNMKISKDKSNLFCDKNKKLVHNSYASQSQAKYPKKKDKKLQGLKRAIKGGNGVNLAKKTLKDFLTLI